MFKEYAQRKVKRLMRMDVEPTGRKEKERKTEAELDSRP